jgi:hypothetical protein
MKYLLLFLLPFSLYASRILSYNIYERSDRADVMITFDTPYNGVIKQSKSKNRIIIKLEDAEIESSKIKKVNSKYLHSITITPLKDQTQILANISTDVRLIASKTSDAYGLRLRFTKKRAVKTETQDKQTDLSLLPTKKSGEFTSSYYIVVGILIVGIIILLVLKKKIAKQRGTTKTPWLFNSNTSQNNTQINPAQTQTQTPTTLKENNVSIRFQKAIDTNNSVVMLEYAEVSYLVLMGKNSSILLDKFQGERPSSQEDFETILQDRNQILEDFIGSNEKKNNFEQNTTKEPLQAYKERAAFLSYNEEV